MGRVHKTLLHFLSRLPQWGDFLEPSLGPPYWAGEGGRGEGGCPGRFRSWARRFFQQPRGKGSREALGRGKGNIYDY